MRAAALLLCCALAGCDGDAKHAPKDAAPPDAPTSALDASAPDAAEAGPADDAVPDATSATLTVRGRHLLEAIAKNSPDLATDMLFPREGYSNARDDKDPARDWDQKVKPGFERAIAKLNKRVKNVDRAVFVSFDLGRQIVRISPKKKGWREPLWRVKHSTLSFTVDGKAQKVDVAEMVAYRGNWYVTALR